LIFYGLPLGAAIMRKMLLVGLVYCVLIISCPFISMITSANNDSCNGVIIEPEYQKLVNNKDISELSNKISSNDLTIKKYDNLFLEVRKVTNEDLELMKKINGVYLEGLDYNDLINGFGTGLKPLTTQEWEKFGKNANIIQNISFNRNDLRQNNNPGLKGCLMLSSSSVDHSKSEYFPPIGNQGAKGSCAAWAVGYYTKTFQEAKEHNWNLSGASWSGGSTGQPTITFQNMIMTPDFIYHQVNNGQDRGTYFSSAMDLCNRIGICTWKHMPYNPNNHTSWPTENAWRQAPLYRTDEGYNYLWLYPPYNNNGISTLKNWLVSGNLAMIAVDAYKYSNLNSNDLWTTDTYKNQQPNHANTIIGFDDNFGPYSENGYTRYGAFKVANSWGTGWTGDHDKDGCFWISYEAMKYRIYSCFMFNDKIDYSPEIVAGFQINHIKRGECNISIGIGSINCSISEKRFDDWFNDYDGGAVPFPANKIIFDITEFNDTTPDILEEDFFIKIYDYATTTIGTILNFSIEVYDDYINNSKFIHSESNDPPINTTNLGTVFAQLTLSNLEQSPIYNENSNKYFGTIKEAIDDNETLDGHTIIVDSGVYIENVILNKSLNLVGKNWKDTRICYDGSKDLITITTDNVNLSGFSIITKINKSENSGIHLQNVSDCIIKNIIVKNSKLGILISNSTNISIIDTSMESSNLAINGYKQIHWNTHTIINLTKNKKPISYIKNTKGSVISIDSSQVILANCEGVTIQNQNINDAITGIELAFSSNNVIKNNSFLNNDIGINVLQNSNSNKIYDNNIFNNTKIGLKFEKGSDNNIIYHNNFISNKQQAIELGNNYWGCLKNEGNHWSDYNGLDNGFGNRELCDGIGDTDLPHLRLDFHPFINRSGWLFPALPFLNKCEDIDIDGNFAITWTKSVRSLGYILEEANEDTFTSAEEIYYGPNSSIEVIGKPNGTYYYRVKAYHKLHESDWSNIIQVVVDYLPQSPKNFKIFVYPEGGTLNLSWDLNLIDTKEYLLYNIIDDSKKLLEIIPHPRRTYNHTGLINHVDYYYVVQARDYRGQVSEFSEVVKATPMDTIAPLPPEDLIVECNSSDSIILTWLPGCDEDTYGYNIYRSITPQPDSWGDPINKDFTLKNTIYIDFGLAELTTYYYVITALDKVPNESEYSNLAFGTTLLGQHAPELHDSINDFSIPEDTIDYSTINLFRWFKDINNDSLRFSSDGCEHINVTINQENGTVILEPEKDWNGQETLVFHANDSVCKISDNVKISVTPVNDPPGPVNIISPKDNIQIEYGQVVEFWSTCDDPDIPYGDELTIQWFSINLGIIGQGEVLNDIKLPIGEHIIIVEVCDVQGQKSSATVKIIVVESASNQSHQNNSNIDDQYDGSDSEMKGRPSNTSIDLAPGLSNNTKNDNNSNKDHYTINLNGLFIFVILIICIIISIVVLVVRGGSMKKPAAEKNNESPSHTDFLPSIEKVDSLYGDKFQTTNHLHNIQMIPSDQNIYSTEYQELICKAPIPNLQLYDVGIQQVGMKSEVKFND
jgi:nitrous oxidase accessory protein NosD